MSRIDGARARLRQLLQRGSAEDRMDEEIRFHLEMETEKNRRAGMSPAEARRRAVLSFGGVEGHREALRDGRRLSLLEDLLGDARFAARSLRRAPGFAATAVLTLALGIAAATAMFSVLDGVLLRDLPVRDEEEVLVVWSAGPATDHMPTSQGELAAFRERTRAFDAVAGVAFQGATEQSLLDGDRAVAAGGTWVTGELFPLLGVVPVHGRALLPSDDLPGAPPVMVLGHGLWQRGFGGDPSAVGRTLAWNGRDYAVVGVLPRGFSYPAGAEFWVPVHAAFPEEAAKPSSGYVIHDVVGRLRPGATAEEARADFAAFLAATDGERPPAVRGMRPVATPLAELIAGDARPTLRAAAAAVGVLLLIACGNVANLLLIRGSARARELAVRAALGAGRGRLVRQLLVESGVLALLGGVLGVALSFAAVRALVALAPAELPRRETIGIDGRVLAAAVAITALAALLSGLLPALLASRGEWGGTLREGGRSASAGRGPRALRHALAVGQVSLSVLVVVGAGLLVRSLALLQRAEMGFEPERLLVFQTSLPTGAGPERARQLALREEMLAEVSAIPGVESAASLSARPFSGSAGWTAMYSGEGQSAEEHASNPMANLESVGPEYFRTLGLPVRRGRAFDARDAEDAPRVAIVSESVARRAWPGEEAVGKRLKLGPPDAATEWHTVVGVVGETRYRDLRSPQPSVYFPTAQFGPMPLGLAVRARGDAAGVVAGVRLALRRTHPEWALVGGGPMRDLLAEPLAGPRFATFLLGVFASVTLLLAAVGIYGALAATVRQRTREIGIRLALGAERGRVRGLVMREGMALALLGCALGSAAALLGTRALRGMLFGVGPADAATYVTVAAVVLAAAALACYLPARRASRVDPVHALRAE